MKKIIVLLVLLLSGCYNYKDINDLAIINTISIKKINNQYELGIEVIDTNKINKQNTIYKTIGNNLDEVFDNIEKIVPKESTYDHIKIILINTDMINDFKSLIDYLFKFKYINDDIYLLVDNNNDYINTNNLLSILKKNKVLTLYDILNNYLNDSNVIIPNIEKDIYGK